MEKIVVLINPPVERGRPPQYFPNGLAFVAAALRHHDIPVTVIDMDGNSLSVAEVVSLMKSLNPLWIGIGGMITRYREFKELAPALKSCHPDVPIVVGNSGAATVPELYFRAGADIAVTVEGEVVVVPLTEHIVSGLDYGTVPGLILPGKDGGIRTTPSPEPIDLDEIAMPAWDLFPVERYLPNTALDPSLRTLDIQISRGCPYDCTFCYRQFGRRVRKRGSQRIIDEILTLRDRFGITMFSFCDDLFTVKKDWITDFCDRLVNDVGTISWRCLGRVDTVDEEMLATMAAAGCREVHYGVESGSEKILREMNKRITPQQAANAIAMTRAAGIEPICSLIFGMPGETLDTIAETVDFCLRNNLVPFTHFATPYPGTALYDQARAAGKIPDVERYVLSLGPATDLLINLTNLSDDVLRDAKEKADRLFARHALKQHGLSGMGKRLLGYVKREGLKKTTRKLYQSIFK